LLESFAIYNFNHPDIPDVFWITDHTRDGVKCYAKTFYPAWFTPFLVWSENLEKPVKRNNQYLSYIKELAIVIYLRAGGRD